MAKNLGINIKIGADLKNFSKDMQNAARQMKKTGRQLQSIGSSLSRTLTLPLGLAGAAMIKFASDTEESLNKVDVAFGDSSKEVKDFADTTLKSFGIARSSALEMASTFGDMATSIGINQSAAASMSTKLVGLAGDLASFKNIRIDVAQTALNSIFTGETESLKKLGIVMTQANLSAFALEKGIQKPIQAMSEGEKVMLRYNFVMEKTANAHGDFERTGGGAANQMRIFQEGLKQLAEQFGKIILPMFTKLVHKLNSALTWFNDLSEGTKKFIVVIGSIVATVGPVLLVFAKINMAVAALIPTLAKLGIAITGSLGPIALFAAAIVGLGYAFYKLNNYINENNPLTKATTKLTDDLKASTEKLKTQVQELQNLKNQGLNVDKAVLQSTRESVILTIKETKAKLENAMAIREQMKANLKAAESAALIASRGVGQQGEFIGVEVSKIKAIQANIKTLDTEINNATSSLSEMDKKLKEIEDTKVIDVQLDLKTNIDESSLKTIKPQKVEIEIKAKTLGMDEVEMLSQRLLKLSGVSNETINELEGYSKEALTASESTKTLGYSLDEMLGKTGKNIYAFADRMREISKSVEMMFNDLITGATFDFFSSLGEAFAGSTDSIKTFGNRLLENLGNFLGQFGKMLIAAGVASEAFFNSLFAGPAGAAIAIAAGAALIIASGAIKAHTKKAGQAFEGTYSGGGSTSYTNPASYSNTYGTNYSMIPTLETTIYGQDIKLSYNMASNTVGRTRGK